MLKNNTTIHIMNKRTINRNIKTFLTETIPRVNSDTSSIHNVKHRKTNLSKENRNILIRKLFFPEFKSKQTKKIINIFKHKKLQLNPKHSKSIPKLKLPTPLYNNTTTFNSKQLSTNETTQRNNNNNNNTTLTNIKHITKHNKHHHHRNSCSHNIITSISPHSSQSNSLTYEYTNLIQAISSGKTKRKQQLQTQSNTNKVLKYLKHTYKPTSTLMQDQVKHALTSMTHAIAVEYQIEPPLISATKFSPQYQHLCKDIHTYKPSHNTTNNTNGISPYININAYTLKEDVNTHITRIKTKIIHKQRTTTLMKWKRSLISAAIHFKRLGVGLNDFFKMTNVCYQAYSHTNSKLLFKAVKDGNYTMMTSLINENKYLLHDFDYFNQTVLHWMAKRNRYNMISFVVKNGGNINKEDYVGRTPLHIGCAMNNIEAVMILLYEFANPFAKDKNGNMPNDLTEDKVILDIFRRVTLLYFYHSMGKVKKAEENIRRGLLFLYEEELVLDFRKEKFNRD